MFGLLYMVYFLAVVNQLICLTTSVIASLTVRKSHGMERGNNAKQWVETWPLLPQDMWKVCFIIFFPVRLWLQVIY